MLHPSSLAPGHPSLFVAGGIGVTPLVSMLAQLVEHWLEHGEAAIKAKGPHAILLYSARAPEEFALLRRLLDLQAVSKGLLQVRLHCSEYRPAAAAGGTAGTRLAGIEEAEETTPRRPPPILLTTGVRSIVRRRVLPEDLQAAVNELQSSAPDGSSSAQQRVTAYVCGPPALADGVVADLEGGIEGVGSVVMERWW